MVVVRDYPIELGWSFLLVVGYLARVLFVSLRLPGPIGILLVGFAFSHFMQKDIHANRDALQRFAFLLVLLNAGFEVSIRRLRPSLLLIALLPGLAEMFGIAGLAVMTHGCTWKEGLVLGCVLFPLGEGLVIPKMNELRAHFPGHPLPQVALTWAPLEATMALSLFSFLSNISGHSEGLMSPGLVIFQVFLMLVSTIFAGGVIGASAGWLLSNTGRITFRSRMIFTGSAVEAFLFVLGLGFGGFGLAKIVPNGLAEGAKLFDPDLFVIAVGSAFQEVAHPNVLHNVENYLAGIWVFGAVILFSMLGSRTELSVFLFTPTFLPFMAVGLCCRMIGFCIAVPMAIKMGKFKTQFHKKLPSYRKLACTILFLWLTCIPRATLQGALGNLPVMEHFFSSKGEAGRAWCVFIGQGAKLYIVGFSIIGSLLLEVFGPKLLRATADGRLRKATTGSMQMPFSPQQSASRTPSSPVDRAMSPNSQLVSFEREGMEGAEHRSSILLSSPLFMEDVSKPQTMQPRCSRPLPSPSAAALAAAVDSMSASPSTGAGSFVPSLAFPGRSPVTLQMSQVARAGGADVPRGFDQILPASEDPVSFSVGAEEDEDRSSSSGNVESSSADTDLDLFDQAWSFVLSESEFMPQGQRCRRARTNIYRADAM